MKLTDDFDSAAAKVAGQLSTDPIDTAARQVVDGQRTQVKSSLYNALLENPDMAARAQRLGRQTGLPADVVQRNMPEVERNVRLNEFDRVLENSPTVAQWLADQNNAAVGHDDVENMGALESALRYMVSAPGAARGGLISDAGKAGMAGVSGLNRASAGVVGLGQAAFELGAPLVDPLVGRILPANPLRATAEGLSKYRQSIEATAKANMPKTDGIVQAGVFGGFASLTTNLATLPMAFMPGGQGAAMTAMVAPVAGGAYGEARDKNIAPIQALTFGVSQAAIEYATEKLPLAKLVGDLKVGAPLYKVVANQVAAEVPGEQLATVLQDLNEWATLNPEKPFSTYLEERPSAAAQTLIATLVGVGGQVSVVKGLQAAVERIQTGAGTGKVEEGGPEAGQSAVIQSIMEGAMAMRLQTAQAEVAGRDAQALTQLTELVQSSKLAQRDPVAFQNFVSQVVAEGPVQDVYVNAQVFAQAAQNAGVTEDQFPESIREQIAEALEMGGDIRIPIAEFAATIAPTEYAQGLIEHLKTDPMGMSQAEAQVFMQNQVEDMKASMAKSLAERDQDVQFKTAIDEVRAEFKAQLTTANRFTAEVNDSYANMLANFYAVTAAKAGMTPQELVKRYPLRVQAEGVQDAASQYDQAGKLNTDTPEFGAWFKQSKIVDDKGVAKVMYHGTAQDIHQFRAKQAGATFVTENADFADNFTEMSKDWMVEHHEEILDDKQLAAAKDAAERYIREEFANDPDKADLLAHQMRVGDRLTNIKARSLFNKAIAEQMPSGPNILPVYVSAQNPFDYQNDEHVAAVVAELNKSTNSWGTPRGTSAAPFLKSGNWEEIEKASTQDAIKAAGFDGFYVKEGKEKNLAVYEPTQIKSVFNRGTFDANDPNILHQSKKADERDLVVTHNLTAENLLHAQKMGGIPVPSLAITKKDTPLTSFGEITLMGKPEMADPKGYASTKVFGADIYSPRYPSVERDIDGKGFAALVKKFRPMADRMGEGLPDTQSLQRDAQRELERSLAVMGQFLRDQGIEPTLIDRPGMTPEREARLLEFGLGPYMDVTDAYDLRNDKGFFKAALAEMIDTYEAIGERRSSFLEKLRTDEDAQANMVRDTANEVANAAKLRQRPEVDRYETQKAMEAQIADAELGNGFQQYVSDAIDTITKSERIFQGFTYSGNRKYIPHNLENVVKLLKKELRGGENFNYGVGSLRAKFTPQFKSVAQIKASKDRLISAAEFEEVKKEIDAEFLDVSAAIGGESISLDTTIAILEGAPGRGIKASAKSYGFEITDEAAAKAGEFLNKLRSLPTAYFEAKILREVDLAEFAGAVVPEGVDPKVIEALQARGVTDIKTYTKGDEADRAAKIGEFDSLFFQGKGNRGQIAFGNDITKVPSIITLLKGADLSTFLHESGHFFLEVQFDLASRIASEAQAFGSDTNTAGEQQVMQDTAELLKWFGVESIDEWFNLPMEQKRGYHEKFARGFEAYLFEGKAPSIELQGMFQRFRAWLLRVYKDLKALNVELTDEVRGVMDRMLATAEQIELAEKGRSMMPLFTAAEQAGMTTEEFAAYQELGTQASQDAIENLQGRTLRDMQWMQNARGREIKRLQKESAARRKEMTMEARREVMSQPTYRAWQFLTGKLSENDKAAVAPEPERKSRPGPVDPEVDSLFVAIAKLGGLDRAQVQGMWGFDPKERSPMPIFGKYLLRKTDGLGIDAMGELLAEYGYLPKDENGKFDQRDLEEKFDAEYRGDVQYAVAKDYTEAMQGERRPGEDAELENLGAGRFDMTALRELALPDEIMQIIVDLKMTAKDGIHPDLIAESFGFTSGDELVRTLAIAEEPKVAIQTVTDQKMLEKYGDLATPEAIERAADQAIHNETRARFVATELNALQKATGKPKVLANAAREFAKSIIDRLQVRNVKPSQYTAAEMRAANVSEKAMKSGDMATAAAEKRNQLVNTYAAKAAHDALTEVEKGVRYLAKFNNDGTRKTIDVDYLDQIDSILERFDLRKGTSLKSIDKRKALAKWIGEQEELGIEVELPEKITAEAFRQSYKDLTVEEFRGLIDSIKQIEHLGRLKEKLLTAADNRRFADVVYSMVNSIEANGEGKEADNRTRDTLGSRAMALFKGFVASHRKVASLARELDGFKDGGPVWNYLIRSMNAAGDKEATMRAEATKNLAALLKPVLAGGRMGGKGQFFPSVAQSLNRGEQLVMALNMGNAGNTQRLLDGRGWTFEQVVPVMQNLTREDWVFVQSVWDFFESYRPEIAAKERRVMGKEPNWVEPQTLVVKPKDGDTMTLRGGYFPIVYDARESGRAEQQADAEAAKQMMKGAFVAATTRRSFTKTRAEVVTGRPLVLTWDALFRGVNDVIHDLSWHEWVIDANRIVKNESVDEAIRTAYGAEVVQQFKASIRDIAAGDAPNMDALSKVLTPLRTGAAVAGLGFNLMNAMLQPLGLTQSIVRVGAKWVAMGAAEWAKSPVKLVEQVHEKSEFMRNRGRTQQRELNEIQSVVQGKTEVRQKLDALMFVPMQSLQLVADMPTWWGAYQKGLAEAPVDLAADVAEDRAIKLADQAVLDAQSGGQVKDLALIQRGGPMQKLFTVFYGYFSAAYNLGVERAKATNYRSPLEVMHLAGDFLMLYSVPAVLASLIKSALTPGGGDDEEELARKLIGEQISYLMGLMVGVREVTGAVQYATGTKQFDMAYGGPAGLRFFQELDKLGKQVGQGELDRALARSVVNVGGVLLHLPSGQINRTIDGVIAVSEGTTDNPAAILFGVEK